MNGYLTFTQSSALGRKARKFIVSHTVSLPATSAVGSRELQRRRVETLNVQSTMEECGMTGSMLEKHGRSARAWNVSSVRKNAQEDVVF